MEMLNMLGLIYSGALTEVVSTVAGIHLEVKSRETDNGFDEVTGVMYMNGRKNGMLFVSASEAHARVICSRIIGVTPDEVTKDDIDDAMCELVNMTAGSAKLRLSHTDYMFTLLQPFVITGKDVAIITKSITHVVSGTLSDGEISIKFKAVY